MSSFFIMKIQPTTYGKCTLGIYFLNFSIRRQAILWLCETSETLIHLCSDCRPFCFVPYYNALLSTLNLKDGQNDLISKLIKLAKNFNSTITWIRIEFSKLVANSWLVVRKMFHCLQWYFALHPRKCKNTLDCQIVDTLKRRNGSKGNVRFAQIRNQWFTFLTIHVKNFFSFRETLESSHYPKLTPSLS